MFPLAAIAAAVALLAIASGGFITGNQDAQLVAGNLITGGGHAILALLSAALTLALVAGLMRSKAPRWIGWLGWSALGALALDAAASTGKTTPPLPVGLSVLHAFLAPLYFSCLAAVMIFALPRFQTRPGAIELGERRSLPRLAMAGPPVVALQILLGAAYRHKLLGVLPHMGGAMLVALLLLILCVVLLQNFPEHPSLRPIASGTLSIVLLQIFLGIVSFILRLLDFDNSTGFVVLTTAHVSLGALVLAASLVLAIQMRRCQTAQ